MAEGYPPVDLRDDLDATARGKPRPVRPVGSRGNGKPAPANENAGAFDLGNEALGDTIPDETEGAFDPGEEFSLAALRETILQGTPGMHDAMRGIAWRLTSHDLPPDAVVGILRDLYNQRPEAARDERWHRDWDDIQRTVDSAVEKIAGLRKANGATAGNGATEDDPWTKRVEPEPPDPLIAPSQPQAPYPLDRITDATFIETVNAVSRVVEGDLSMVGTIVLSAMATAVARIAIGVELEAELIMPASVYTADIVGSSERKTSAEKKVYAGIQAFVDDELIPEYQQQLKEYTAALAIYEHDKRSILSQRGHAKKQKQGSADPDPDDPAAFDAGGSDTLAKLMGLEEPVQPLKPNIISNDFTVEGMRDMLAVNSGQLAVVTSEGAVMFSGYSLGDPKRRSASAGSLSRWWDGLSDTTLRASGRVIAVQDPRVCLSIGVQPRVAATFFTDLELRDQGIVNRFLAAWPAPLAGTRTFPPPAAADLAVIRKFNEQAQTCLRLAHGLSGGMTAGGQTQAPRLRPALPATPAALDLWRVFAQGVEHGQAKGQRYEHITGWAGKAAEQAARISLIVTLFADPTAQVVDEAAMATGIHLAWWYCDEWLRITEVVEPSQELKQAMRAAEWIRANYGDKEGAAAFLTARDLYRNNVAGIATREPAERALQILAQHGVIETLDPPKPKQRGWLPLVRWRLKSMFEHQPTRSARSARSPRQGAENAC
jgi:hypothetical protein